MIECWTNSCEIKLKVTQSLSGMSLEAEILIELNMSKNKKEVKSHAASEGSFKAHPH